MEKTFYAVSIDEQEVKEIKELGTYTEAAAFARSALQEACDAADPRVLKCAMRKQLLRDYLHEIGETVNSPSEAQWAPMRREARELHDLFTEPEVYGRVYRFVPFPDTNPEIVQLLPETQGSIDLTLLNYNEIIDVLGKHEINVIFCMDNAAYDTFFNEFIGLDMHIRDIITSSKEYERIKDTLTV